MKKIILASSSQSRKKIFKNVGLNFLSISPKIDEEKEKKIIKNNKKKISAKEITKKLCRLKCKSISNMFKDRFVVGCDTMIEHKKKNIDKAKTIQDAEKKIFLLSGSSHFIYTSVCVYKDQKKIWEHTEKTKVFIRPLTKKEVKKYIKKCGKQILNSVGCYQAEKMGPQIFSKIDGDFYNVLGFPIIPFINFLVKRK